MSLIQRPVISGLSRPATGEPGSTGKAFVVEAGQWILRILSLIAMLSTTAAASDSRWIWVAGEEAAPKNRFTYFRKVVELDRLPPNADILFAADSTAQLWVNGHALRRKVARFHEAKITAEVVDAAPALRTGKNIIVVLHHNWGPIVTFQRDANLHAGLWIGGAWLQSDQTWKAIVAPEFARHEQQIRGANEGNHTRIRYPVIIDGRKMFNSNPHSPDFDDSAWPSAVVVTNGPWPAVPANVETPGQREFPAYAPVIPAAGNLTPAQPLSSDPLSISRGIRTATYSPEQDLLAQARRQYHRQPTVIRARAGESRYITYDFQQPMHGFPFVDIEKAPAGVTADLGYGEIAVSQYSGERHVDLNGWINSEGVAGTGYADRYITRAGAQRIEFPDERTARWYTLHFHFAADGELVLREAGIVRSQYPLLPTGNFYCGDQRVEQIVRLCRTHAEIGMNDAYVDTPGREDGEWIEDSRVRAIISSRWFGDEKLRRLVLRHHAESSRGDGGFHHFPPSNYKAYPANYDWAVQWSAMLYDDYMWTGRTDLITRYWDNLSKFWENTLALVDRDGLWRTNRVFADIRVGVHPSTKSQSSGIVTPFIIQRLRWSAQMAKASGHAAEAANWQAMADKMTAAFRKYHLIPASGSVPAHVGDRFDPDNPSLERGFSQAAQVNAILAGMLTDAEARALLDYVFPPPNGTPPAGVVRWNNPTFAYRSLTALSDNGMINRAVAHLMERYAPYLPGDPRNPVSPLLQGPYGGPLPEYWISREDIKLAPGQKNTAQPSDETGSHAWGAVPILWMHESLLGVRITEPGGGKLRIMPNAGGLPYVAGETRTPKGQVWVEWRPAEGRLEVEIPAAVTADVILPAELRSSNVQAPSGASAAKPGVYLLSGSGKYVFRRR